MKTALTIAGSDSIGGAGIQADLKTMCAHKIYGMTVITAVTAQNTMGVQGIHAVPAPFIAAEIDSVFQDIVPDAVKIGMLANEEIIRTVAERLRHYKARHVVLDPVMVSTSRHRLLEAVAETALVEELLPLAQVITPNLPEAEVLSGVTCIDSREAMVTAARRIAEKTGAAILVKGGHLQDCADDLLWDNGAIHWYHGERIQTDNTHGTGCTLSSAIACELAVGVDLSDAVRRAKEYITEALRHDPKLGHGNGPLNHCF